jgi:exonuclease SbcC
MIITSIKLTSFGKHKKLEFNTDMPVVGIIGPNGSGKSTALNALKFLFTGSLDDNLESYIRNGDKRAVVEATFLKNGQPGKIVRKVTATTSSRELTWNGEVSTKASEVDAKVADILGADKHAVSNAVFIPQGDLDRILFGDQAEREKLFTRLVNVAFLEKTVGIMDGKIKAESAGIENLTPILDEVRMQTAEARNIVKGIEIELLGKPDQTAALKWLQAIRGESSRNAEARTRWETAKQAEARANLEHNAELKNAGYASTEELTLAIDTARYALDLATSNHNTLLVGKQVKERLSQRQVSIDSAKQGLERARGLALAATAKVQGKDLTALYQQLLGLESRAKLEKELETAKQHLEKIVAAVDVHLGKKIEYAATKTTVTKEVIEQASKEIALLQQTVDILKAVLKHPHNDNVCPVCSQGMGSGVVSVERLNLLETQLTQAQTRCATAQHELKRLETAQRDWETEFNRIDQAQTTQTQRVNKLTADFQALGAGDLEQVRAEYKACSDASAELQSAQREISTYTSQLALFESQQFSAEDLKAAEGFSSDALAAAIQTKNSAFIHHGQLQTLKQLLQVKTEDCVKAAANATAALATLETGIGLFKSLQSSPPSLDLAIAVASGKLEETLAEVTGKNNQRLECAGRLTQAQNQLKALQTKENEIEDRLHKNAARQQVVDDLIRLRGTLARQGLPLAYVEYQFLRLTTLAQQSLSELGSNFTIEVHPERPVAFTFTRLDEADGVSMDQNKLSGGQRVRLSIAFLLAVQKLLIPEVGLLVLDEPSTHLDQDSVDALKELLMGMAQTLQNSEHQVWVVDHHETLQTAFGSCLQLK